jgi:hypothetical protein
MTPPIFLDVASQFLRMEASAGYLLVAAEANTGKIFYVDIVSQPDASHWRHFLSGVSPLGDLRLAGIVHPGNPDLEDALNVVYKSALRQLCIRHFLSALYHYLRSFKIDLSESNTLEMRFYRAVSQLLKAPTFPWALKLYGSLASSPEFAVPALENPLAWLRERFPLLTTHYRVPGMPAEAWAAQRAINEIIILLKSFRGHLDRSSALAIIRNNLGSIEKVLSVDVSLSLSRHSKTIPTSRLSVKL